MILALAAGLVLGGVPLNTIWVAVSSDAAPCTAEVFEGAFRARLGQMTVLPGERDLTAGQMQVVVRPGGQGLELRVRGSGERELIRELPGPGTDCFATSETAALMVERYLDEMGSGITEVAAPPLLPLSSPRTRWGFALEGALTAELQVLPQVAPGESTDIKAVGPGGWIALGVHRGSWQLSALGAVESTGTAPVAGSLANGTLHVQAYALALALNYLLAAGPGAMRFELAPGTQLFSADTSSPSPYEFGKLGSSFTALPFVAFGVGYQLPVWGDLFVLAKVSTRIHLGATQLEVEGVAADTVYTRRLDGELSVGLGYVFY